MIKNNKNRMVQEHFDFQYILSVNINGLILRL